MIRGDNRMLLLATNGDVWAVNDEQGALLIPQGGGPVLTFTRHNVLPSERLLCIAQDSTGSIWLGTWRGGLSGAATDAVAKAVRLQLSAGGYAVGGIDMALAISVAVAAAGDGESALLALGRADHLLRTSP